MPIEDHNALRARLLRSSGMVSAMTSISRVLGFIRDMVLARLFGAGVATDAFFVAFKIPNFMRRLFAEGAFSQAFVPVFAQYKIEQPENLKQLLDHVSGTLSSILLLVTTLGVCAAPLFILVFAPGFTDDPERYQLAAHMLRITFPYLFFISLTALAAGILNSFERFAVPALTPVFLNISLIVCAYWLSPQLEQPVVGLAWGVFIAGLLQFLFQIPFLQRLGLLPRPRWGWRHPGVRRVIKLMLPALFGSAVVQINLLLDTLIASFLIAGSVSWLYYSDRLVEFPLGVFGIALATVLLPQLSRQHAEQTPLAFQRTLDWGLRLSLLIGLPAMLGLALLANPILATLFQYGEFSQHDTRMAAISLTAYALGLPAFILVKVLGPGFYAQQDTQTPVRIGIIAMISNMALNFAFVVPMIALNYHAPHAGLALATAGSAWLQAFLLYRRLRRDNRFTPRPGWRRLCGQHAMALLGMAIILIVLLRMIEDWSGLVFWQRGLYLGILIAVGSLVYLGTLYLGGMRLREISEHE